MAGILQLPDFKWVQGYVYATLTNTDDTPIGTFQSADFKDTENFKEVMGPESLTAVGVGTSERKITVAVSNLKIRAQQLMRFRSGTRTLLAAITNPSVAPTLTPGAGATSFTAGFIAVAYAYRSAYGTTLVSPIQTASVTAGQQIAVTAITPLPAGVTSADWYMSTQSYATAPLAAAAALAFSQNNNGATFNLTAYPAASAAPVPAFSNIGIARTVFTASALDEPPGAFRLHLMGTLDGSQIEAIFYNCVCPDISHAFKLRDYATQQTTFNVYSDPVTGRIYDFIVPGDQTAS